MVVYDRDVIIFSVKDIKENGDFGLYINRWERRVIHDSANQIYRAERMISMKEEILSYDHIQPNDTSLNEDLR